MDPLDFTGRVVVVTGGTRGLGAVTAHAFQAAGAHVLVCARTAPSSAGPGRYPVPGPRPAFFRADVRDPAQAAALAGEAVRRFGRIDVLINNAGGAPTASAGTASPRLHAKIIELNLIAPLHVSQAANAVMCEQSAGGVILMIGSVSGTRPSPGTAAYGAAKAGLHHLATSLAAEWAPKVRVNSLVVGPVDDPDRPGPAGPDREVAEAGAAASVARTVPMGRAASAGEVASACLLLASPLAGYITGAALAVHGGGEWPAYLADLRDTAYRAQK
ncbi:SDR family oxidoreductase [Actinoplanes sp. NPDC049802]|uniref:SDR family oxidoreductase n=1 Tax=Actinoplanes sp. NPDC049802 TaxID=3154742 RepID=UPI0033FA7DA1